MQATRRSLFPPVQSGPWTLDLGRWTPAFLHHFCTDSSPIFTPFWKQPVANQQLTIQNCTIGTDTARVVSSATFSNLWTLYLGLWIPRFCTISAPFLHRFSHDLGIRPLIINQLRKKLHRDILSHAFTPRPPQPPLRLVRGEGSRVRWRPLVFHPE